MRHVVVSLIVVGGFSLLTAFAEKQNPSAKPIERQAKAVLAQTEGKIRIPGLKQPVEILRDNWGVAHIYAQNSDDLFFAQGFVAAQDRLFQIDMWRRIAVGETAEVLGEQALEGDRFARLVRYRGGMKAEWKSYSPDTKQIATSFTNGINAYIKQIGNKLPIEFQIIGAKPKLWQPEDVLGRMSGIIMTSNFRSEIVRAHLIAAAGFDKAAQLAPIDPRKEYEPAPGLDLKGIDIGVLSGYYAATKRLSFKPSPTQSNNWVISGKRSVSGKPMLASDPHRAIALPSLRYLVHLHAPGWNVIGSGEPGLPGVAIGHNERIAWGFTIVCTDQADVLVEDLNPKNHDEYKSDDGWKKIKTLREPIIVKGKKEPVEAVLRFTEDGPIIHEDKKRHRAFVLKWVGSEPGTAAYLGSLAVGRAQNWKQFLKAAKAWKLPNENLVYADVDGNIGWVAAALTPVRKNHQGLLPVPAEKRYGWKGFLKVKDLPQEFNPKRGYIYTANHNILPPDYEHLIALDWAPGYRAKRVEQMLESKDKFTLDDFKRMQHDVTSLPGQALIRLAKAVDMKDAKLEALANIIRKWDGVLSQNAQAGPLHAAWLMELEDEFFHRHMPESLHPYFRYIGSAKVMLNALEKPDKSWFGKHPKAKRDEMLRSTFAQAVAEVEKRLGKEASGWTWGKLHTVTFHHPLEELGAGYKKAFNRGPLPRPGDALTPHNTRHNEDFEQIHGPSYRQVFDLADWDKGYATSTPGQSGQLGSPHYDDLLPLWSEGKYFPLAYSRQKVEQVAKQRLQLMPK